MFFKKCLPFAVLLCLFGLSCSKYEPDLSFITHDQIDSLVLPDQTRIILNNYSNVFYHAPYQHELYFSGEGRFIVNRGNGSPLRLRLGPNVIECQNGEFNLSTYDYELKAKYGNIAEQEVTELKLMVLKGEVTVINDTTRITIPENTNAGILPRTIWWLGAFWDEECGTWPDGYYHFEGMPFLEFQNFLQTHFQIKAEFDYSVFFGQYIFDIDIKANEPLWPQLQKIADHNRFKVTYNAFDKILKITT